MIVKINEKRGCEIISGGRSQKVSNKNTFYTETISIDDSGHEYTKEAQE